MSCQQHRVIDPADEFVAEGSEEEAERPTLSEVVPSIAPPESKMDKKAKEKIKHDNIVQTGRTMKKPCTECARKQNRTSTHECKYNPDVSKKCALCLKSHRNCVFDVVDDDELRYRESQKPGAAHAYGEQREDDSPPSVPKPTASFSAVNRTRMPAVPLRRPLPSAPIPKAPVQRDYWNWMEVSQSQLKNTSAEVAAERYPTFVAKINGKLVKCAILTPLEQTENGQYRVAGDENTKSSIGRKRTAGFGGGDGSEDEEGHSSKRARAQDADDIDFHFACEVCGIFGDNFDDGTLSVACFKCARRQHAKCQSLTKDKMAAPGFEFVCKHCVERKKFDDDMAAIEGEDGPDRDPRTGLPKGKSFNQMLKEGGKNGNVWER